MDSSREEEEHDSDEDLLAELAALFADEDLEALLPAAEERAEQWAEEALAVSRQVEQRYIFCNRLREDLSKIRHRLCWSLRFSQIDHTARHSWKSECHSRAGSQLLETLVHKFDVGSLLELLPSLRAASRKLALAASSLQGRMAIHGVEQANKGTSLLLSELRQVSWEEPYADDRAFESLGHLPNEARIRRICMQSEIFRVWSSVPGCGDRSKLVPHMIKAVQGAKDHPSKDHPDVFAARVELAQLLFADGQWEEGAHVAKAALADAELFETRGQLPGTEVQQAQLSKEFQVLRTCFEELIDHQSCIEPSTAQPAVAKNDTDKPLPAGSEIELVMEDVQHAEQAAEIPPEEAATIAQELWAAGVQRLARESHRGVQPRLVLITFSRHSVALHEAILGAPLVKQLAQDGVEIQPEWANGAFVLAPIQGEDIDLQLHSRCVLVVGEEQMMSLLGAVEHLQYADRKLKPDGPMLVPESCASLCGASASSTERADVSLPGHQHDPIHWSIAECPVRNTFIDFHMPDPAAARAPRSV